VIETPEESKITVFIKGILSGLNKISPDGGHLIPKSRVGEILL
jgi:hypothetical protein